eukprot:tig00021582_g22604.t1
MASMPRHRAAHVAGRAIASQTVIGRPSWSVRPTPTPAAHSGLGAPRRTFFGWFRRWAVRGQINALKMGPDPEFEAEDFLEGAKQAFSTVYRVICSSDKIDVDSLKPLVGTEMLKAITTTNETLASSRAETGREMRMELEEIRDAEITQVAFEVHPIAEGDRELSQEEKEHMVEQAKALPSGKNPFEGRGGLPFDFPRREYIRITVRFKTEESYVLLDHKAAGRAEEGDEAEEAEFVDGARKLGEGTVVKDHSLVFRRCYMSTRGRDEVEDSWKVFMMS